MKLNDVPFAPVVPPDVYEQAKKWLIDNKSKFYMNANFAVFNSKGMREDNFGRACHAGIQSPLYGDRCLVATEIGIKRKNPSVDKEPFLKWFTQESPYSRFILNRNDYDFIKEYGVIISADVCTPVMQNAVIMTRHFHEVDTQAFSKFNELTASGVDPKIAYPLCFNTSWSHLGPDTRCVSSNYGHRAHPLFNLLAWKNWMAGEIGTEFVLDPCNTKTHYRNFSNYQGGVYLFHDKKDKNPQVFIYDSEKRHFLYELMAKNEGFRKAVSDFRKQGQSKGLYRPPNPFVRNTHAELSPDQISYQELWQCALPWCLENGVFDIDSEEKEVSYG